MKITRLVSFRHAAVLAAATLVSAAAPHADYAPAHWALIIGISDYQNFGDEMGGDLPGAVNDANAVRDVAVSRFGVPPENIHLVLDGAATRARIESEFTEWLPSVVGPDDVVWIFFAGHGSQVWDTDMDEDDGLEETICPTDVSRDSPDMDIVDDEIQLWLNGIPASDVVVLWDKCHAESSTRAVTLFARPRALDRKPEQDLERPSNLGARELRASRGLGDRIVTRPSEEWRGQRVPNIIEVAASQADEVAVDAAFEGQNGETRFGGAFTTNFVRNAWQAPSDATLEDLFERTVNDLRAQRFQQRPDLNGESTLRTRSIAAIAAGVEDDEALSRSATVPVVSVQGNDVTLGGGANAGATVGSVYTVGGALLRVTAVEDELIRTRIANSELRGLEAVRRDSLVEGAQARLVAYVYPPAELRVSIADVPAGSRGPLQRALASIEGLSVTTDVGEFAHLLVRPSSNGFVVLGLDGFVRHHIPASNADVAAPALHDILIDEVQAKQLADLENPAQPFALEFSFNEPDNSFGFGDLIEFSVVSHRSGYLTIVDTGTGDGVSVIFPNELDTNNRIEAGQAFVFPTATMQMVARARPPAGRGVVRAFVTERPLVVTVAPDDPLFGRAVLAALQRVAGETPVRDTPAMPVTNWATAALAYDVTE